jgi:signal transduction histidine kinase
LRPHFCAYVETDPFAPARESVHCPPLAYNCLTVPYLVGVGDPSPQPRGRSIAATSLAMPVEHDKGVPEDAGIGIAHISLDGKWLAADQWLRDLLGMRNGHLLGTAFDDVFEILEPEREQAHRARLLRGEILHYVAQRRAVRERVQALPVRIVFSMNGERNAGFVLAVIEDLTALRAAEAALDEAQTARHELARRLTNAQEKERTRIARELHDDIGQSIAILRIQMLRAGQPVSGIIGKRYPTIPELCDNLKSLAEKISRISHQLHSSELEYLGLAVAIQGHCREFSKQYKIAVECSCEEIPDDLNSLLAVSVLRIVQEALHNAAKHSQAKLIQVAVHGSPSELSLLISDDGVGFNLEEARLSAGLGLISMRERVHLANGEFNLTTAPGEGTCIAARIPLGDAPPVNSTREPGSA